MWDSKSVFALHTEPFSLPTWLNTLLPAIIIATAFLLDILCILPYNRSLHSVWRWLSYPFRNFLALDDLLLEPVDRRPPDSQLKIRALASLSWLASVGWIQWLALAFYTRDKDGLARSLVYSVAWCYIALKVTLRPPSTPPYLFITFTAASTLLYMVRLGMHISEWEPLQAFFDIMAMIAPGAFTWVAGTLPLKTYRPSFNVACSKDAPSVKLSCPEDNVNLWSWSTFTFVQPLLDLAMKRTLQPTDVWTLSPFFRHKNLFMKYLDYRSLHQSHSLIRFLISSNSLDLILDITLELWSAVIGFVPPYALQQILAALGTNDANSRQRAFFWTMVTFVAHLSFAQKDLFQSWHTRRCYERTRGQLFCAIHYKALRRQEVSGRIQKDGEVKSADLGKIINLMQGDTYSVAQRFWEFSGIFTSPIRIVIALTFLYQILGWSALSGVVVVLVAFILNYPLAQYDISITRASWKAKDSRMDVVNELLQNIRFLKFYGWEYKWSQRAEDARETELKWRVKSNIVDTAISFIWVWMPSATALTSFMCYTLIAREELTVSKAFTAIALFSQLQTPMVALPGQVFAMLHAYVSMQRIEDFLKEDEVPDWASTLSSKPVERNIQRGEADIGFCDASFVWKQPSASDDSPSRFTLGPLNIKFPLGKLTIVSGATGSGKSALLVALLGEVHCISGTVMINKANHQVAYCAQNPWLEHATIRDNIIFGSKSPFDQFRYERVLDACALRQDLSILIAGDMTEIGEKGITLSGGQRARIALARALYSQAKCILLDDPLAAVDMHTAQHLVKHCFSGELAVGRTIILVTHHISLCLPVASYVVELDKGMVLNQGTISELTENGHLFQVINNEDHPLSSQDSHSETTLDGDQSTTSTIAPRPVAAAAEDGKLIDAEARAEGRVSLHSYTTYIKASGIVGLSLTILFSVLIRAINIGNQFFLSAWSQAYEKEHSGLYFLTTKPMFPWKDLPPPTVNVKPWLMIYLYISIFGAFATLFYIILGYYTSLQASRSLFLALLKRLTRAPMRFFDTTPIGRILNRFTTDINTIDNALQNSLRNCLTGVLNFVASFAVMLFIVPTFAPFALVIAWLYIRLAPPYVQASRDLRRLESISLSPAFAGFDELLRGIVHIRAFGMENRYQDAFYSKVDTFQSFDHVYWLVNSWLRWRYDCLGSLVVLAATLFALWQGVADGPAAIVIVQAGIFADASRQLVKVAAQVELDFNSVERVVEYLDVPQEAPAVIEKRRPPAYWPSTSGELVVDNLLVKYAPKLPAVLHDISFTVRSSEKIGVVGRTGSGKSTLAMSLLRMIEPTQGKIILDGIDISSIGLEDLRTRVTIVSQDVALFTGTIRSNLDPLGQCTEEECLQALDRCHLTPLLNFKSTPEEPTLLDMKINQNSMSAGEKQLLSLARATLRRTSIIIMDEATSQIDSNLDDQIQRTIREELAGSIVITIAHRLKTVMDYDRILVLDEGNIVEYDTPEVLLGRPDGHFRNMCKKSADWASFPQLASSSSQSSSRISLS